jgi:hypothetical protein
MINKYFECCLFSVFNDFVIIFYKKLQCPEENYTVLDFFSMRFNIFIYKDMFFAYAIHEKYKKHEF